MLILTSRACPPPDGTQAIGSWFEAWPGPVVFVALPGHGLRYADLRALEARAVVVDCLEAPPGTGALLCEVVARMPWLLRDGDGPLVVAATPADEASLQSRHERGLSDPRIVEAAWSPGGRLDALLLGSAVARHPLAPDTMALLRERRADDATTVSVLSATLGGRLDG